MTAREVAAALAPAAAWAEVMQHALAAAHEAIRLEAGQAAAETKLRATRTDLAVAQAELQTTREAVASHQRQLAAERDAAVAAWQHDADERTAALDAGLVAKQRLVDEWELRAMEAQEAYDRLAAGLTADEAALRGRITELRDLATRLARAGEAVLR